MVAPLHLLLRRYLARLLLQSMAFSVTTTRTGIFDFLHTVPNIYMIMQDLNRVKNNLNSIFKTTLEALFPLDRVFLRAMISLVNYLRLMDSIPSGQ